MKLHFRKFGNGQPLLILHGVFGSSDNWQTVGKELAKDFTVYLIDQRNHGNSPHSNEFNYEVMSQDLLELIEEEQLESVHLIGHSMGGKTAMQFATSNASFVNKLVVVDIAPKFYEPHHQQVIAGFRSIKLNELNSRGEAERIMSTVIPDVGTRQFLLKNLKRNSDGFEWKINLDVIEKNITNVGQGLEKDRVFHGPTLFIGGGKSNYILADDLSLIASHFPNYRHEVIDDAGHWVHAEKPKELYDSVTKFLRN